MRVLGQQDLEFQPVTWVASLEIVSDSAAVLDK